MEYRHLPHRARGTEDTVMTLGGEEGSSTNILARATAALNTDLEGVTTELVRTQDSLTEAHDRIRQLEAQLAGRAPPPADERGVAGQDTGRNITHGTSVCRGQMVPVISIRLGPKWACGPEKTSLIKSSFSSINGGD